MTANSIEHLIIVGIAGLLEGIGVPWPALVMVAAAGVANQMGWPGLLLIAAVFGTAYSLGALAQYGLGRFAGPRALAWLPQSYRIRLENLIGRYGQSAVFLTRPLMIGNYISAPAGIMRMPLRRFLVATFAGILPWAVGVTLAGDLVSKSVAGLQAALMPFLLPSVITLGCLMAVKLVWMLGRRIAHH